MAGNVYIGQQEQVGFGIEATPGTAVAAQAWQQQTKFELDYKTTKAENKSGLGRVEDINGSAVTEEYADGSLSGIVEDIPIGYLLLNMLGSCSAALHGTETAVWDNTFTVLQSERPPSITFTRINPNYTRWYSMGTQSDLEFSCKQGEYAMFDSTVLAKVGTTATATAAYAATPNLFTSKHVTVKYASTVTGLTSATALQPISFKLKITRKSTPFTPLGVLDPISFDPEDFGVTGEIVLRYADTTEEGIALANTIEALQIAMVDTDVTIGTAANPALTFTMPQTRFTPIKVDTNLDKPLTQTIPFTAELDQTAGYMVQAVLTDTQDNYVAA